MMMDTLPETSNCRTICEILEKMYPQAASELHFSNPFECLIATMLSAQCTDQRVNMITRNLFKEIKAPEDVAVLSPEQLEKKISSCNYYKTKSRHIFKACQILVEEHRGMIPDSRDSLMKLPGVGRKTANVVVSNAFGKPAIAVDTHVFRVANRLGLTSAADVLNTEIQLMERIPEEKWSAAHHWLILHGRRVCDARKPACDSCQLAQHCAYYLINMDEPCRSVEGSQ